MKMRQVMCIIMALFMLSVCGVGVKAYSSQTPVRIDSNSDFSNIASSGNGTVENPWIIDDLDINGSGYGYCIYIGNTTDYFIVKDCYLHDAFIFDYHELYQPNAGIVLNNVQNGIIKNNEMSFNDELGIFLYDSSDNLIQYNNISDNEKGIFLSDCSDDNEISYNNASSNSDAGIAVEGSEGNWIFRNTADYNGIGVHIKEAVRNIVEDNLAFYNNYALHFENSENNTAKNNSFCLSNNYGAFFDQYSEDNEIFNNNFGNNSHQAYDAGSRNKWHGEYQFGGNYWSYYFGDDNYSGPGQNISGSDDMGDSPFQGILGGASESDFPLKWGMDTFGIGQREDPNGIGQREDPN